MAGHNEHDRRRTVTQMLARWHLEGFKADAAYLAMLERYIAGEVTLENLVTTTGELFAWLADVDSFGRSVAGPA